MPALLILEHKYAYEIQIEIRQIKQGHLHHVRNPAGDARTAWPDAEKGQEVMRMNVKVYSTPSCPYCHMEKDWLREKKVPFTDVNVAADREAAMEMIEKTGQMGVPVTDVDGQIVIGFDKGRLEKLLKMK